MDRLVDNIRPPPVQKEINDGADALWQIRNSILYPQRMKRHKHAKLLVGTIVYHIQQSKYTNHLYKV
jgi:hypothetical protein